MKATTILPIVKDMKVKLRVESSKDMAAITIAMEIFTLACGTMTSNKATDNSTVLRPNLNIKAIFMTITKKEKE